MNYSSLRSATLTRHAKPTPKICNMQNTGVLHFSLKQLAITLLLVVVTNVTAWAETANVSYIDADSNLQNVTATILTGNETYMSGWCVVNSNISYDHGITLLGELKLILADGCTMSIGSADSPLSNSHAIGISANVNVYGQSDGTGTLDIYTENYDVSAIDMKSYRYCQYGGKVNITSTGYRAMGICADYIEMNGGELTVRTNGDDADAIYAYEHGCSIYGGKLNVAANGSHSYGIRCNGNLNLGYKNATDRITFNSLNQSNGYICVVSGKALTDGNGNYYYGNFVADNCIGKILQPAYYVVVPTDPNGISVASDKQYAEEGAIVKLAVSTIPEYQITNLTVNVNGIQLNADDEGGYSFSMPAQNANVSVSGTYGIDLDTFWGKTASYSPDGTADKPYIITSTVGLNLLATRVNSGNTYGSDTDHPDGYFFELGNDISFSRTTDWNDKTSTENNFDGIGGDGHPFKGTFDGKGYTINGIRIYRNYGMHYGLFGYNNGTIKNLVLSDTQISCVGRQNIAGIAGLNGGTIDNCCILDDVMVRGDRTVGGVAGYTNSYGTVSNCVVSGTMIIASEYNAGAIVGYLYKGTVSNCFANGAKITAPARYGALFGLYTTTISSSNFYHNCTVNSVLNATNVGATTGSYPDYTTHDIEGAEPVFSVYTDDYVNVYAMPSITYNAIDYYVSETAVTLDYTDRPGYTFSGYESSDVTVTDGTFTMPAKDIVIIATWTENVLTLANNTDNSETIAVASESGKTYNHVTLTGRTLYKDGNWNTLCLPFDVDLTDENCPFYGATAKTLSSASITENATGETLHLTFGSAVETLEAGVPYIIRWEKANDYVDDDEHNIVNPVFSGVTITATGADNSMFTSGDYKVSFLGTYSPATLGANTTANLFLGAENKLHYPTQEGYKVNACRAYFTIDNTSLNAKAFTDFVVDFGDGEATSVHSVEFIMQNCEAGAWYSIDGRPLTHKPAAKGVYIHGGKKVVIP